VASDAVREYKRIAKGKKAIVFCPRISNAQETAEKFKEAGIGAAVISSKESEAERQRILSLFASGAIQVIANVDVFSEGYDCPDIEAVILLNKTLSLGRYRQWVGRGLRPAPSKDKLLIIDHCGNLFEHGLPNSDIQWSLDRPPISPRYKNIVACRNCNLVYSAYLDACPACGTSNDLDYHRHKVGYGSNLLVNKVDIRLEQLKEAEKKAGRILTLDEIKLQLAQINAREPVRSQVEQVREWFIKQIRHECSDKQLLDFVNAKSWVWWVEHFNLKEIYKDGKQKCLNLLLKK
jgi:superfamily II DNA or RNA helicase